LRGQPRSAGLACSAHRAAWASLRGAVTDYSAATAEPSDSKISTITRRPRLRASTDSSPFTSAIKTRAAANRGSAAYRLMPQANSRRPRDRPATGLPATGRPLPSPSPTYTTLSASNRRVCRLDPGPPDREARHDDQPEPVRRHTSGVSDAWAFDSRTCANCW
jgi:hypothetical protein